MQINIEKQHFYFILGLFIVLIGGLFYVAIQGNNISGETVKADISAKNLLTGANVITGAATTETGQCVGAYFDSPNVFGMSARDVLMPNCKTVEERILALESRGETGSGSGSSSGGWPSGSYCILKAARVTGHGVIQGDCPSGFAPENTNFYFKGTNVNQDRKGVIWIQTQNPEGIYPIDRSSDMNKIGPATTEGGGSLTPLFCCRWE